MSISSCTLRLWRRQRRKSNRPIAFVMVLGFVFGFVWINQRVQPGNTDGLQQNIVPDYHDDHFRIFRQTACIETRNFVYIKMIKCASTTLTAVLRRFGLERNLSFVLPPKNRIYIGWPYEIEDTLYRPPKSSFFNILCEHAVYNRDTMQRIMPSDTIYITSLREPFSQFKSMLNYYNIFNISGISSKDPLHEYLENMDRYETVYKSPASSKTRYCIPDGFSMTRNLMAYNLGFPTGFLPGTRDMSDDSDFLETWIKGLDADFHLVIITEYFHESMVMLRRLMCWKLRDILFSTSNQLRYGHRNQTDATLVDRYKRWSKVDYILYNHFNTSLWTRLNRQGDEFWEEVQHFRRVNNMVNRFCDSRDETVDLTIPQSTWYDTITIPASFCKLLREDLLNKLQEHYESLSPTFDDHQPSKYTC